MNNLIISNRNIDEKGIDLYFYNVRTLMIFQYEIMYQLLSGVFSTGRSKSSNSDNEIWSKANLYLTIGKKNARIELNGFNLENRNHSLRRVVNCSTAKDRISVIGRISNTFFNDIDIIKLFLDNEFHEYYDLLNDYDYNSIDEGLESIISVLRLDRIDTIADLISNDPDIMKRYYLERYSYNDMLDDMGMIQNTMRRILN